jgi:hypothetical protein
LDDDVGAALEEALAGILLTLVETMLATPTISAATAMNAAISLSSH